MNIITDKKTDQEPDKPLWLDEFSKESIEKSAEVDIHPKLTIEGIGIEYAKDVVIMSEPYIVEIPKEKAIGNSNKLWMIDLQYEGTLHQFIAQSGSFRFQLGVLMKKLGLPITDLIGFHIKLWKEKANIKNAQFKGLAEVYVLKPSF